MNSLKTHKFLISASLVMLFIYFWISIRIPYILDDWNWGISKGVEHLFKADLNSRYVGNFIEILVTRSTMLKVLIMSFVFIAIPFVTTMFVSRFIRVQNDNLLDIAQTGIFLLSNAFILLLPNDIWRQTNGWVAGFSNYVISGLALLLYFYILLNIDRSKKRPLIKDIGLLAFGLCIQLILENVTLFVLVFSLLYFVIRYHNLESKRTVLLLILGNLIGFFIMFENSILSSLFSSGTAVGGVRKLFFDPGESPLSIIYQCMVRFCRFFIPYLISYNGNIIGCISLFMGILIYLKNKSRTTSVYFSILNICFSLYYFYSFWNGPRSAKSIFQIDRIGLSAFSAIIDSLFIIIITIEFIITFNKEKDKLFWLISFWLSPLMIISPMIIIQNVGPRSFYSTDLCYIMLASVLLGLIIHTLKETRVFLSSMVAICCFVVLLASTNLVLIYKPIGDCIREREQIIEKAIEEGSNQITMPDFPNKEYVWTYDPNKKKPWQSNDFKEFFNIPSEIDVWFESWGEKPDP